MNEYMQFVAKAKHDYSSVTHVDGTARVQVVKTKTVVHSLRQVLEEFYEQNWLSYAYLNTSLNIKGKPMVNTWKDAQEWSKLYNVAVF